MQPDRSAARHAALMNFRHLSAVLAVCETGNIARAAQQLQRPPAAVSRSVREVELALDVPLFERAGERMRCTAFGHAARDCIGAALQQFACGLHGLHGEVHDAAAPCPHVPNDVFHAGRLAIMILLADLGHVPSVMQALGITRAVVTRSVNFLERSLNLPLFTRTLDYMAPTDAVRVFAGCAQQALRGLGRLPSDIAALRQNECFRPAMTPFCALPTPTLPPADRAIAAVPWLSMRPVAA